MSLIHRSWSIVTLLFLFYTNAFTQSNHPLNLQECIDLALENNVSVRSSQLNTQLAVEKKRELFTGFFPSISASAGIFAINRDALTFDVLTMPIGLIKSGNIASVLATQPVFAGGRIVNGNKLARVGVEVSRIEQEKTTDEVALQTEQYYWDVVVLQAKLQTINTLDSLIQQLLHDVSVAVKVGVKMPNDLLQVQLRQNEVEVDRLKVENGLSISRMLLAQYVGVNDIDVASPLDFNELPPSPLSLKSDPSVALLSSYDYRLLEKNVEAQRLNKRLELGKHLPTVAVGAGLSTYDILDERLNRGAIFATVSVPLSDWWGGAHALKQAKIKEELAKQELEDSAQRLIIRMQNEWNSVEEMYKQLAVAKKSIEQSCENLRLNTDCYRAGTIPLSDLLQAQMLFRETHNDFVETFAQYHLTISKYLKDTASLTK